MTWPKVRPNPFKGKKHKPETIEAIKQKLTGKPQKKCPLGCPCGKHTPDRSETWRENVRRAGQQRKGRKMTQEGLAKMSKSIRQAYEDIPNYRWEVGKARRGKVGTFKNRKHTEESKELIRRGQALTYSKQGYLRTSIQQNKLFGLLRRAYPESRLNYQVKVSLNRYRYVDVAIPSLWLAVEYDGAHWHQDEEREVLRDLELRSSGWVVLHVDYSGLQRLALLDTETVKQELEMLSRVHQV